MKTAWMQPFWLLRAGIPGQENRIADLEEMWVWQHPHHWPSRGLMHPDVNLDRDRICIKSQGNLVGRRNPHVLVYPGSAKSHRPDREVGKHSAVPSLAMLSSPQALLPPGVLVLPPCPGTTQWPGRCVYIHWERACQASPLSPAPLAPSYKMD